MKFWLGWLTVIQTVNLQIIAFWHAYVTKNSYPELFFMLLNTTILDKYLPAIINIIIYTHVNAIPISILEFASWMCSLISSGLVIYKKWSAKQKSGFLSIVDLQHAACAE